MTLQQTSQALALLYFKLEEARKLINEIMPLARATGLDEEDPELVQRLELTENGINDHFKSFRLQAERIKEKR